MDDQEIRDRFSGIHGEYKEINESLTKLTKEQIKCNAEHKAALDRIDNHLGRINGSVECHDKAIRQLEDFRLDHETIEQVKAIYRKEAKINRRLLYAALLGLLTSIILNLWEGFIA